MNRRSSLRVAAALWLTVSALSVPRPPARTRPGRPMSRPPGPAQRAVLDRYCVTCHSARAKTGGLVLEKIDLSDVGAHSDIWEKVVRKVRAGMMPPPGMPAPPDADKQALLALARDAARSRGPGLAAAGASARPSTEPRRVRQRHPRPAGPRDRPGATAAGRRFQRRLRQHRRRAGPFSGAARELSLGGRPHQRAGDRRPEDAADGRGLSRAPGRVAVAARRRTAARYGGRVRDHSATSRSTASTPSRSSCSAPTSGRCAGSSSRISSRSASTASGCTWPRLAAIATSAPRATTRPPRATRSTIASRSACRSRPARAGLPSPSSRRRTATTRGACSPTSGARRTPSTSPAIRTSINSS